VPSQRDEEELFSWPCGSLRIATFAYVDVEQQIRDLAHEAAAVLAQRVDERAVEMTADDRSHYLIYRVLGVSEAEGSKIDLYQNTGRFLYRHAGGFVEKATKLCFLAAFPKSGSVKIPNTRGQKPKTFEIDCLVGSVAHEIKWRDATTDGDHITKEHTRLKATIDAGYEPVRVMYFYPLRTQAIRIQQALEAVYAGSGGRYYWGDAAWDYIESETGVALKAFLEEIADEISPG